MRIITHCLRKDPARRFQHIDDVKTLLEELKEESESGRLAAISPAGPAPARRRWLVAGAAAAALAVVAAGLAWWFVRGRTGAERSEGPIMRLTLDSGLTTDPTLSPDGKLVAYASDRPGGDNPCVRVTRVVPSLFSLPGCGYSKV